MPDRSVRLRSSERRSLHLRSLTHETIWGRKLPSSFTVPLFMRFTALKTKLRSHKQSFTVNRKPHLQSQLLLQLSWTKTSFQQSKTRTVTLMKCMPHISYPSIVLTCGCSDRPAEGRWRTRSELWGCRDVPWRPWKSSYWPPAELLWLKDQNMELLRPSGHPQYLKEKQQVRLI